MLAPMRRQRVLASSAKSWPGTGRASNMLVAGVNRCNLPDSKSRYKRVFLSE